jgi:hypothetical protein
MVNKILARKIETKSSIYSTSDGQEIFHNNFLTLESGVTLLATGQGTGDAINATGQRIGDEINVKGIKLKLMIEMNERYSDVTFRLIMVKSAKGDTPTRDTLWRGNSGNKMLDNFNSERYTIMFSKYYKLKATGTSSVGPGIFYTGGTQNSGAVTSSDANMALSRATKIIQVWIPGSKFGRAGRIVYENSSTQPKMFDYTLHLYAYSNYSTLQDIFYVARLNDYVKEMYYTDA